MEYTVHSPDMMTGSVEKQFFTSSGWLKIKLLEASDLLVAFQALANKSVSTRYPVYAILSLLSGENQLIQQYESEVIELKAGYDQSVFWGEEYVFNHVENSGILRIDFHIIKKNLTDVATSLGIIQIPLARLEEDVSVSQWYQLMGANESGLRSAVKVEVRST